MTKTIKKKNDNIKLEKDKTYQAVMYSGKRKSNTKSKMSTASEIEAGANATVENSTEYTSANNTVVESFELTELPETP
ncbi:hypothetical protein EOD39_11466 [Acipenser ruthenus]|uniref:Uncharacterized protein n=1 Tax=Acipenser ruthenus TaxID=7906 RepID=A0A662YRY0_ACIRT|nr:hypothetical protein EOD39_11466 [Acipenser ruthenus]